MTVLTEGNLQITIPDTYHARKFDDRANHGLSHCMKAVDFIVELPAQYLFIEFKDPQHPNSQAGNRNQFIQKFQSGRIDEVLKQKYRDSFLYEWASGRAGKPIHYLVIIAIDRLTEAELATRRDNLVQKLPVLGPGSQPWPRPFVKECAVFNIETWNRHLPDYPIVRLAV